jgi:hypothetical protein
MMAELLNLQFGRADRDGYGPQGSANIHFQPYCGFRVLSIVIFTVSMNMDDSFGMNMEKSQNNQADSRFPNLNIITNICLEHSLPSSPTKTTVTFRDSLSRETEISSPNRASFLRIAPGVPLKRKDMKILRSSKTTLSSQMRAEALNNTRGKDVFPKYIQSRFPSIDTDGRRMIFSEGEPLIHSPTMSGITSLTASVFRKPKSKLLSYYKQLEKQTESVSRLSGLPDTLALELNQNQLLPNQNKMTNPSTLCVKCSAEHASLCMECGQLQTDDAVELHRIARAEGALRFFDHALVSAGLKTNTIFVIFRLWKNYTQAMVLIRRKMFVASAMRYRRVLFLPVFRAWKRFIDEQKLKKCHNEVENQQTTIQRLESMISQLRHEQLDSQRQVSLSSSSIVDYELIVLLSLSSTDCSREGNAVCKR